MTMPAASDSGGAPAPSSSGGGGAGAGGGGADAGDGGGSEITLRDRMAGGMGGSASDGAEGATGKPRSKADPAKPDKPAAPKYKVRRGDAEEELEGEELARRLSDDYEEEFTGPGGKKFKVPRAEIGKRVALSEGAKARMERAALTERRIQEERAAGKKDPIAYLEGVLGVEDAERWALELAMKRHQQDEELAQLTASQDPRDQMRAEQMRQDRVRQQLQRREGVQRALQKQAAEQQRLQGAREKAGKELQDAFKATGLPWSSATRDIGARILKEYADADIHLPPAELATEVKRTYLRERRAELDAMDGPALFAFLGEGLRAKLRQFEVEAMKGAKKQERETQRAGSEAGGGGDGAPPVKRKEGESEGEYLRRRGLR